MVTQLVDLGLIAPDWRAYFHGGATSAGNAVSAGRFNPAGVLPKEASALGVLSPIYRVAQCSGAAWLDFYDDWALAPDINPLHRAYAADSYRYLREHGPGASLVTVNTPYMAGRLKLSSAHVVPNGVEARLAGLRPSGDAAARLVLLGKFFAGRTDWGLIERVARTGRFDEIVVGHPGPSREMGLVLERLHRTFGEQLVVMPWISDEVLASLAGPSTVALIPHVVTDYTLSQDLMKVYQLQALGIRIICPRLLWPQHLDPKYAFLVDFGVDLNAMLPEWVRATSIPEPWRLSFIEDNSWRRRGERIARLLEGAA